MMMSKKKPPAFAPDFIRPRRPGRWVWGLAGALACACAVAGTLSWHWRAQAAELKDRLVAERGHRNDRARPVVAPVRPPPAYAASAREMLAESRDVWLGTLTALERVARVGVTPVAVEVSAKDRSSRVDVEFTDYAVLLAYRSELDQGNPQPEWSLESAQAQPEAGKPGKAVLRRTLR
jgi:hypothetical protein